MAKKCEFQGKPAYDEDEKIILQLDEDDKLWIVYHKATEAPMMGPNLFFKQKKEALAYARALIESFDLNFIDKQTMFDANGGEANCNRLRLLAVEVAKKV